MNTVTVSASKTYDVLIGPGLLRSLGAHALTLGRAETVCIVSDSHVFPLYGQAAVQALEAAGFRVSSFCFPAGEAQKNGETYLRLLNHLAQEKLTRSDLLVALGGGVVGDLTGFAAATFLRGIRLIQIPTTLLAAVDSSVGGKTAIDLPAGKNLAGAFCQPSLVLCDTSLLASLPEEIFRDGCAEVIKYGVLYDPRLFSHLAQRGLDFDREAVITRCVELKRDVVAQDEFDTGLRMKLNLGHTIGHGVEALSQFSLSHGKSVAIGMAIVSRAAVKMGYLAQSQLEQLIKVLEDFGLPTAVDWDPQSIYSCTLSDKKRSGSAVKLIVPRAIGSCEIVPVPVTQLMGWIQAGMT